MNSRAKKILLLLLAVLCVFGAGQVQRSLNRDRDALGLTRAAVLDNAPPVLAFTTVALGSFRGLISNFLWMRASDLQQDDKFFEAAQLADWITKLEPTYPSVWIFQGWNMSYNISVKFKDFADRWRWVQRGIELMRDEGLRYNPNSVDLYRELAWQFQHKMGANLDDANMFYKMKWADEMGTFFGPAGTNLDLLLNPPDAAARTNAALFRDKFKMDAQFAKQVDAKYGPLDWRLPEAHAIYWGAKGLAAARENPDKVKADDLIKLRRIIYQSMQQTFLHGKIVFNPYTQSYSLGPNLDIMANANTTYEEMIRDDTEMSEHIGKAHRNFLRDAIYFLYVNNRMAEAQKWFKYLGEKYPKKPILDSDPNSLPGNLTLDEYAVTVVQVDIGETSQDRVTSAVQGLLSRAYFDLAAGREDRYENLKRLTVKVYERYVKKTSGYGGGQRIPLPPFETLNNMVLKSLLDAKNGLPYAARAELLTRLGLPSSLLEQPVNASTNAVENLPAAPAATNAPAR
jgi:hypothetical protein